MRLFDKTLIATLSFEKLLTGKQCDNELKLEQFVFVNTVISAENNFDILCK